MAPLNILRTILRAVPMRSHAARYAACVLFACVAAVVVAVPVFGQTTATTATLVGAGDIANCTHDNDEDTAQLLGSTLSSLTPEELDQARVMAMGDNAYPRGNRNQYANCYDNYRLTDGSPYNASPSHTDWWGQYKDLTMPVLGNHEYMNSSDPSIASKPYFDYFSAQNGFEIGDRDPAPVPNDPTKNQFGLTFGKGYYSYDLGSWHIVALNSNCEKVGGCEANSPQGQWLRDDLAANATNQCTLAYFHHPLYATGTGTRTPNVKPFWEMLYTRGADVILSGHAHRYEHHAPRNPDGQLDSTNGIRQFVVGTGGEPGGSEIDTTQVPNFREPPDKVQIGTFGVLKLDLGAGSYSWTFVPIAGQTFTHSGSGQCHGAPGSADSTPPTVTQVSPLENAANVSTNTTVTANFSETMNAATINADTFTLTNTATNSQLPATVSYDETNNTATLTPISALADSITYRATVTTGAQDLAGNALDQDPNTVGNQAKTWMFTTEALSAPSNLSATRSGSLSNQRIDLSWTDNSSSEAGFVVERSTTSSFTTNLVTYQRAANTRSYSDRPLQRKTTYYYRVFAVDSTGTRSAPSNVASATTK
jgi:acid phosphatase type 7